MKKLFIVLFAIVLVASFVNAQGVTGYGPKAQLNLANVSGDRSSDNKMLLGFGFGGFLTYNVIPELDIQAEAFIARREPKSKLQVHRQSQ
jgi:hypothetical protein